MKKALLVDNRGDEIIKVTAHWPASVPINGFTWIAGFEHLSERLKIPGEFLVGRPGPTKSVDFPDELYVDFANLSVSKDAVLRFANTYGPLRLLGRHFHKNNGDSAEGDSWRNWQFELRRFQQTLDLWERKDDAEWVNDFLVPLRKPGAAWLLQPPNLSLSDRSRDVARAMVVNTTRYELASGIRRRFPCIFSGCKYDSSEVDFSSQTALDIRFNKRGSLDLVGTSSDLEKTVWLQLATYLAGQRKLKNCEAPDCNRYMDVTEFERPGARRMHKQCEERMKKRRYRENLKRRKEEKES